MDFLLNVDFSSFNLLIPFKSSGSCWHIHICVCVPSWRIDHRRANIERKWTQDAWRYQVKHWKNSNKDKGMANDDFFRFDIRAIHLSHVWLLCIYFQSKRRSQKSKSTKKNWHLFPFFNAQRTHASRYTSASRISSWTLKSVWKGNSESIHHIFGTRKLLFVEANVNI